MKDRSIRPPRGRPARCGIVLSALLAVTACGSEPPGVANVPSNGLAPSTLTKERLRRLNGAQGAPGVPPRGEAR
jgi:hypothetical protein